MRRNTPDTRDVLLPHHGISIRYYVTVQVQSIHKITMQHTAGFHKIRDAVNTQTLRCSTQQGSLKYVTVQVQVQYTKGTM